MKPKIIFIHGMFLTPKSWEKWVTYFEGKGYECISPAWPLHEGEPSALRASVPTGLGDLGFLDIETHFKTILQREERLPILMGHSLGGLLVQKFAAQGLMMAGICICPIAPNQMMAADVGFIRNVISITNPLAGNEPFLMTAEGFHQNFANTISEIESAAAFESYAVHESRKVLRDTLGEAGTIDVSVPHCPLLFVGAKEDAIIPSSLVRRNAQSYKDQRSFHEYTEFTGRGHFICGEPLWEEVAEKVANWLDAHLNSQRA